MASGGRCGGGRGRWPWLVADGVEITSQDRYDSASELVQIGVHFVGSASVWLDCSLRAASGLALMEVDVNIGAGVGAMTTSGLLD